MPNSAPFGARIDRVFEKHGPLCVGIDPHSSTLQAWGLDDEPDAVERFAMTMIEAASGQVGLIKPQAAFFERFASRGLAVLEKTIAAAKDAGLQVILDAKRGDIGSTMQAYAQAYLDPSSPLAVDAITVSPYLGVGALRPAFDLANAHGKGLFVLARTSNPEGKQLQLARRRDGETVAQTVIDEVAQHNDDDDPMGSFGVVVGATIGPCVSADDARMSESTYGITHTSTKHRDSAHDLSHLNGPILVPGMGTQGGKPGDLARVLGPARKLAIPAYSRQISREGPSQVRLREAMKRRQEEILNSIGL
ncbi:orotidine-5'-phosphate decarboxylase [Haloglycomyces albus]|uniref:orotidine-5'-phosphate decarboxylase n=1 Tax=Haloglycomyces albus TaxID=526067 RepID=UPI00046D5D0D|nr:orotidine-5'-phosphate decarboxylase [Haloglycomyces albus]